MDPHLEEAAAAPSSGPPNAPSASAPAWIPIRSLSSGHRDEALAHLLALPERDRYLRFGQPATDHQIERYVQTLDFGRDEVFGIFNRKLDLLAMAHLAFAGQGAGGPGAEFGVSVLPHARGRGLYRALLQHRLQQAHRAGQAAAVIQANDETSGPICRRVGFGDRGRVRLWVR